MNDFLSLGNYWDRWNIFWNLHMKWGCLLLYPVKENDLQQLASVHCQGTRRSSKGGFQVAFCTGWISYLDISPDLSELCDSHQRGHSLGTGKPSSLTSNDMCLCVNFPVSEFSTVKWHLLLGSSACVCPGTKELNRLEHRRVASETSSWQTRWVSMVSGGDSHKHTKPLSSFPQKLGSSWLLLRILRLTFWQEGSFSLMLICNH